VARNRQRAKERQARRRAREGGQPSDAGTPASPASPAPVEREDLGRSDEVLTPEPDLEDEEHFDPVEDEPEDETEAAAAAPAGRGGSETAQDTDRPRLVQFLFAVRAELGRVQWPDRQALTTLTGVVLGFVLIAGGYLGLLDAIFSRLIQAIL
jgi:preprotein translocase SecE subunit